MTESIAGVRKRCAARLKALLLCIIFGTAFSGPLVAEVHTVHVNDGSVQGLVAALEEAAGHPPSDATVIILGGRFVFDVGQVLPAITYGNVTLLGGRSAAGITATDGWVGPMFDIGVDATVRLSNLEFSDIDLERPELISNRGELEIRQVQFRNNVGIGFCLTFGCRELAGRIITNWESGRLLMDGVSFVDSGAGGNGFIAGALLFNAGDAIVSNSQVYLSRFLHKPLFANEGTLQIDSASFFTRRWEYPMSLLFPLESDTTIANSIVVGFPPDWCASVRSLGFNLIDEEACTLDGAQDLVGIEADLIFAPVEANWNPQGKELLTHALEPLARSVAVDSGAPEYCTVGSLLGPGRLALDGDGDGVSGCDRGAVERVPATLARGGVNGLFYNPDADGHYVYIAETTYTTMVMWTTFDNQGRQAWVFGIGDEISPSGRLVTDAWINRNGAVRLDGTLKPANAVPWGRLEVRMQSCNRGRLIFDSDQPGFGSGEFPIRRLAVVDQLECVEAP